MEFNCSSYITNNIFVCSYFELFNNAQIHDLENVVNDSGYQAKKIKDDRGPNISSEVLSMNSEKLNLSRKQFFRHRKKTLAALGPIHTYSGATKKLLQNNKPLLDGMWTTLISTASKPDRANYIRNSNICMQGIIPDIVKGKNKTL